MSLETNVDPIQVDSPVMGEWAEKFSREEPLCEANECDCDGHEHTAVSITEPTTIIADERPKLTDTEIRRLRRQFITVIYPRVAACGHKYIAEEQPRKNCPDCWFTFFQNHGELVQTTDELFNTDGGLELIKTLRGGKFLKMFLRFMSTIAHIKKNEENMQRNGTGG